MARKSERRVLICAAETGTAFAVAASLRRLWGRTLRLITADSNPAHLVTASRLADRHLEMPPLREPGFAAALAAVLTAEGVTDYIPLHDGEFAVAEQLRPAFPDLAIWSGPLFARLAGDKIAAQAWLEELGLPVPARYAPGALPDQGTLFAKPRRGYGSRGAAPVAVETLRGLPPERLKRLILQEVCAAPEVTVDSFYDARSGAQRAVARERLAVRAGICIRARLFEEPLLAAYAARIGEALQQRGTICFQAMRRDGGWAIIDLNLRPGAGTAMTVAAGIDLLGSAAACRWGEDYAALLAQRLPPAGLYVTRQYAEFVMS